jgi:very-short-patch-repair endonuclease
MANGGGVRRRERRSRRLAKNLRQRLTDAETIMWSQLRLLRSKGAAFRRQHPIGAYIADFACQHAKLVVEIDGATHSSDTEHLHDQRRDVYLRSRGWRLLRVWNTDVYENLDGVMRAIDSALPPPRHERSFSKSLRS